MEQERTALESWDRDGTEGMDWEAWRLQRLAADPTGDMRKARVLALEAVAAARTQQEKCQAMELQLLLEREAGHQEEALQLARRLLALAPTSDRARQVFRSALQYRARATLDQGPAVKRTRTWKAP